jgi:FAD:protein FMN transferase
MAATQTLATMETLINTGHRRMNRPALLTLVAAIALLAGCNHTADPILLEGFAQGTTYHLTLVMPDNSQAAKDALKKDIEAEFARLDKAISNYRPDSTIEEFNALQTTEPQELGEEIGGLVSLARDLSQLSGGCYDLTVKPLFDLWGFKKDTFHLPTEEELAQVKTLVGMDKLFSPNPRVLQKQLPNLSVDLSSIGQGYSVGRMADIVERHGITNYIVEIGGELKTRGTKPDGKPFRIALEKPLPNQRKLHKIIAFTSGEPMSLMSSGTYRHYFDDQGKRYSHILDARTGRPVAHQTVSVAVLHPDPTIADAWSTALLCLGSEAGLTLAETQGLAILYIDLEGDQLIEKRSKALERQSGISLANPPSE